mgnify:FL=1
MAEEKKGFFARLKGVVKKFTDAGYKGVHLDTYLQMVITDEQVAKHHLFYPKSPLILVTNENMPKTIEEVENLFMKYPIYPQKSKEEEAQNVADLLNAVDESTTEKESKPDKKTGKKEKA